MPDRGQSAGAASRGRTLARHSLVVMLLRIVAAGLQVVFSVLIVASEGAERAGVILAALAAIELSALVGRLGVPVFLTRLRSSVVAQHGLPALLVLVAAVNAAIVGLLLGSLGTKPVLVAAGSAAVAFNFCVGFWHRGASRFVLATLSHPLGPVLLATASIVSGVGDPLALYVLGAFATSAVLAVAARGEITLGDTRLGRVFVTYGRTYEVGLAEIGNLLALRGIPVVLVAMELEENAAVFDLAVRAFRPLLILQFAFTFVVGPTLAERPDGHLGAGLRRDLSSATGLLQLSMIPYAVVTLPLVIAVGEGFIVGEPLPSLTATWLVLLVGHVVIVGTGPTGQLLLMRGHERLALVAAIAGAAASISWFVVPLDPWLRAAGAATLGFTVQTAVAARGAWRTSGWIASPAMAADAARRLPALWSSPR